MPTSKKPRKRYHPKFDNLRGPARDRARALAFNDGHVLTLRKASQQKLDGDQVRNLQLLANSARDAMEKGKGTQQDVYYLAFVSNVCLLLCERGIGPEFIDEVRLAQEHIVGLLTRLNRGEHLTLTGPGIAAVRRLLELHDAQVAVPDYTEGLAYSVVHEVLSRMAAGNVLEVPA